MTQRKFLTADWNTILMLNYAVDASLLERFVPAGTELDLFEGKTYLSLVGFEFNHTRIFGLPVPFHQSFEEVNLRFYVKRLSKRGVVFIRELVPRYAVAAVARFAFNENYSRAPMSHRIDALEAEYTWGSGPDRCAMRIVAQGAGSLPPDGAESQFITEHYWATRTSVTADASNTKSNVRGGRCGQRSGPAFPETPLDSTEPKSHRP
jgi:uncharacterized protein YqjF (DUF2071 family)